MPSTFDVLKKNYQINGLEINTDYVIFTNMIQLYLSYKSGNFYFFIFDFKRNNFIRQYALILLITIFKKSCEFRVEFRFFFLLFIVI